nr:YadA-like family protein [Paralysiella testudinis]
MTVVSELGKTKGKSKKGIVLNIIGSALLCLPLAAQAWVPSIGTSCSAAPIAGFQGAVGIDGVNAKTCFAQDKNGSYNYDVIGLSAETLATLAKVGELENKVQNNDNNVNNLTDTAVVYDSADKTKVTLNPRSDPATLTNVKDGSVVTGSKDAVNGGQLFGVKTTADKAAADAVAAQASATAAQATANTAGTKADAAQAAATAADAKAVAADGKATAAQTAADKAAADAAKAQTTANTANTKADKNTADIATLQDGDKFNVKYDSLAKDKVTLGGVGGTTVAGVKNAALAAGSTEAVNGAQLFDTNQRVAANSRRITINEGNIQSIINGEKGLVQTDGQTTTVDKAGTATTVALAGVNGDRTVSGVKAGTLAAGSNEAVNGAQLFDTNQKVADNSRRITVNESKLTNLDGKTDKLGESTAANLGGGAAYNQATGTVSAPSYTVAGGKHNNVGSAFAAVDGKLTQHGNQITNLDRRVTVNEGDIQSIIKGEKGLVQTDGQTTTIDKAGTSTVINVAGASGDRVITGVANGSAPNDAINKGQFDTAIDKLVVDNNGRFDQLSERIDANRKSASQGIAAAMAMDIEYPEQHPGEWAAGVGMGTYDGQTSLGMGVNYLSRSGKFKVFGGFGQALTSGSRPAAKAGIGFVF